MRRGALTTSLVVGVVGLAALGSVPAIVQVAQAANSLDKAWPCVQRKRVELSVGTIWAGPSIRIDDGIWSKDAALADLVKATTSRRTSIAQAKAMIDVFAAMLKGDKAARLALLFSGQFQTINAERKEIMAGIERYARRQQALAKATKKAIGELNALASNSPTTDADRSRLDKLNEKLKWDTRIHAEREQSLRYVCDVPVLLEQRLFALGRHIMTHLPN